MKHEMKNKIKINSDGNCVIENRHYPAVGFRRMLAKERCLIYFCLFMLILD